MTYSAEISRLNPTCFLFLIDQSASMADAYFKDRNPVLLITKTVPGVPSWIEFRGEAHCRGPHCPVPSRSWLFGWLS